MKAQDAILYLFFIVCFFILFQYLGEYHFYYLEQYQLFRYTPNFFKDEIFQLGGLNSLITDFFLQFFSIKYVGALYSAITIGGIGMLSINLFKKLFNNSIFSYLGLLTVIPFIPLQLLNHFYLTGTLGFLISLALIGTLGMKKGYLYAVMNILFSIMLYLLFGAVALFFSIALLLLRFRMPKGERLLSIYTLSPILLLMMAGIFVRIGYVANLQMAITPAMYFESLLTPPMILYIPYAIIIVGILFGKCFENGKIIKHSLIMFTALLLLLLPALCYLLKDEMNNSLKEMRFKQLDYYAMNGQWQSIISECQKGVDNFLYMNFLNLALLEKGQLGNRMFNYDQRGPISLWVPWNKESHISTLLGQIALSSGQISLAQRMFFEGEVSLKSSVSGRHLKQLIKICLAKNEMKVAEKYINLLEQTLLYKDWAKQFRTSAGLDVDKKINGEIENYKDNLYSSKSLFNDDPFFEFNADKQLSKESNKKAVEFEGAYLLLKKDLNGFKQLIEKYYGTPSLPSLPKSFQEGVISYSESDSGYWKSHGVEPDCVRNFISFKKQLKALPNKNAAASAMYKSYRNTYWYFYMYK